MNSAIDPVGGCVVLQYGVTRVCKFQHREYGLLRGAAGKQSCRDWTGLRVCRMEIIICSDAICLRYPEPTKLQYIV